jgi:hypothetical protein
LAKLRRRAVFRYGVKPYRGLLAALSDDRSISAVAAQARYKKGRRETASVTDHYCTALSGAHDLSTGGTILNHPFSTPPLCRALFCCCHSAASAFLCHTESFLLLRFDVYRRAALCATGWPLSMGCNPTAVRGPVQPGLVKLSLLMPSNRQQLAAVDKAVGRTGQAGFQFGGDIALRCPVCAVNSVTPGPRHANQSFSPVRLIQSLLENH